MRVNNIYIILCTMNIQHPTTISYNKKKQQTHVQKSDIARQRKVVPVHQRLIIKVRTHIMRYTNYVRAQILKMTIQRRRLFEEGEFDHVSIVIVDAAHGHYGDGVEVHVGQCRVVIALGSVCIFGIFHQPSSLIIIIARRRRRGSRLSSGRCEVGRCDAMRKRRRGRNFDLELLGRREQRPNGKCERGSGRQTDYYINDH